jgi:RNA polymerase sigma-70 factor (ECF subfamily)
MYRSSSTPGSTRRAPRALLLEEDEALARALVAGDRAAAPLAFRRFYPVVHTTLRRLLGPGDDLPDLAQDVFIRFFAKVPELKKHASLRAFVTAIAFRRAREERKKRRVRRTSVDIVREVQNELSSGRGVDPEQRHAISRLYGMMDRLADADRNAYALRFLEGLELAEIAAVMKVSLSTVRRNLRRASSRIDELMRGDPVLAAYLRDDGTRVSPGRSRRR